MGVIQVTVVRAAPPQLETAFDREVRRLHLADQPFTEWVRSRALRKWVGRNYNGRYIPEELLKAWKLIPRERSPNGCGAWEKNAMRGRRKRPRGEGWRAFTISAGRLTQ